MMVAGNLYIPIACMRERGGERIKKEKGREMGQRRERERGRGEIESQYVVEESYRITNLNFMRNIAVGEFLDANGSHS